MAGSSFARAVAVILLAIFLFDVQGAIIKFLGGRYAVPQIATFRNAFGLIPAIVLIYLSRNGLTGLTRFRLRQWPLAILRGASIAFAQYTFYLSLTRMEFATASTLAFAGPLFITALSVPILHHHVGMIRWTAVIIGFAGIVMVMRPGHEVFEWVSLLPLCAAFGYGLSSVLVRLFDDDSSTPVINFHTTLCSLSFSAMIMLATDSYVPVEPVTDWAWLLALGLVGGVAVFCLIVAYRLTEPSNLSPFEYFGIPFSFLIGWLIFDEAPFDRLLPGVFLIVGGGLLIFWRERRLGSLPPQGGERS